MRRLVIIAIVCLIVVVAELISAAEASGRIHHGPTSYRGPYTEVGTVLDRASVGATSAGVAIARGIVPPSPTLGRDDRAVVSMEPRVEPSLVESPSVSGTASWYRWRPSEAAAGPALRDALGPDWRGSSVRACTSSACVLVSLTDWCQCYGSRVIDLDLASFAALASPSRGLVDVQIFLAK